MLGFFVTAKEKENKEGVFWSRRLIKQKDKPTMTETYIAIPGGCSKFGRRITAMRALNGMSRIQLAAKLGLTYESVRSFETGQRWPGQDTIAKLFQVFPELKNG